MIVHFYFSVTYFCPSERSKIHYTFFTQETKNCAFLVCLEENLFPETDKKRKIVLNVKGLPIHHEVLHLKALLW